MMATKPQTSPSRKTSADQMVPEQSTSAVVLHHPGAVYYTVKGAMPVA